MTSRTLIEKVVIPVAGLGTRLLPATKEQPKEMLPIFARSSDGGLLLKPLVQLIFEHLFDKGLREFCFVVGRQKRAIEDHFSPDYQFLDSLSAKRQTNAGKDLEDFYGRIEKSKITWINQHQPLGYGHAVLLAESFVGTDDFLLHAGDTFIISENDLHLDGCLSSKADSTILVQWIDDPKEYGVIVGEKFGELYRVTQAVEKPKEYISNLAIMPINSFRSYIFDVLKEVKPGVGNEIQLTDAIQKMVGMGKEVIAYELPKDSTRIDIGTPKNYWDAQRLAYSSLANETRD